MADGQNIILRKKQPVLTTAKKFERTITRISVADEKNMGMGKVGQRAPKTWRAKKFTTPLEAPAGDWGYLHPSGLNVTPLIAVSNWCFQDDFVCISSVCPSLCCPFC